MTRKEIIARANSAVTDTFATGAQWANGYSEFEMVNKQKFIDKVCEWLDNINPDDYMDSGIFQIYDLIGDLRKAMEE